MAFSKDVRLPLDRLPVFPRRCIVCGRADPEASVAICSRGIWQSAGNPLTLLRRLSRKAVAVRAPACDACALAYRRRRVVRRIVRWLGVLGMGAVLLLLDRRFGLADHEWLGLRAMTIAAIVLAAGFILPLEYFYPLDLDIAVHSDAVEYEFRDPSLALEFARLNGARIDE